MVDGKSLSLSFPFNQHWSEEDPFLSGVFQWERWGERGWGFLSSLDELRPFPVSCTCLGPSACLQDVLKDKDCGFWREMHRRTWNSLTVVNCGRCNWFCFLAYCCCCCSDSLWLHRLQHTRLLCLHYVLEFAVHWVWFMSIESVMLSYHLILGGSPSPAFSLSQHHSLFQWVNSSHQVGDILELQLQHQTFQWIFRVDFL